MTYVYEESIESTVLYQLQETHEANVTRSSEMTNFCGTQFLHLLIENWSESKGLKHRISQELSMYSRKGFFKYPSKHVSFSTCHYKIKKDNKPVWC